MERICGARYARGYVKTPGASYLKLLESCTILNPDRKPFTSTRTINSAEKTRWERYLA